MWHVTSTASFDKWLGSLKEASVVEVVAVVRLLRQFGPRLSRPHADTLKGSRYAHMKELRVRTASEQIRIAFAFDPDRHAVLLLGADKRGVNQRRFYRRLIGTADSLYAEHLRRK